MKIQPPGAPPPGPKPDEIAKPEPKTGGPQGPSFADKLGQVEGKSAPTEATATPQAGASMAAHLDAVAREMAAGRIRTREEAVSHLVDRVLDARFEGKLPPDSLAKMKTAVAAQVASDPNLSERIDRLLAQES